MSKISNVALELDESAAELGFADHLEAMANGYDWAINDYGTAYLFKRKDPQEEAHEAWLKERTEVLEDLGRLHEGLIERGYDALAEIAEHAMNFIEKGEL